MKTLRKALPTRFLPPNALVVAVLLVAVVASSACGGATETAPSGAQLKRDITAALDGANLKTIAAQVIDGDVTLSGTAPDQASVDSALQLARSVKGVKSVVNQITLEPVVAIEPPPLQPPQTPDELLAARLRLALAASPKLAGARVDVTVLNGVAILTGSVPSDEAKATAEKAAAGVPGIASVESRLEVIAAHLRNVPDDQLEENVQKVLDRSFGDLDLTMTVSTGMVTIRGAVRDRGQILQIAEAIRTVDGVRGVDTSLLTVEGGEAGDRIGTRAPAN
jgi:hyperosmotically inducible protein